jgi:hypothetical protein
MMDEGLVFKLPPDQEQKKKKQKNKTVGKREKEIWLTHDIHFGSMLIAEPLQTVINFLLRLGRLLMAALCRFFSFSLSLSDSSTSNDQKEKKKKENLSQTRFYRPTRSNDKWSPPRCGIQGITQFSNCRWKTVITPQ